MGESYGGYLTLWGLGKQPDLWAGGMALNGIADWSALYQDTTSFGKSLIVALFRGTPEEQTSLYHDRSPITYVEHVRAPVLLIHGMQETWALPKPIERYEALLKAAGQSVDVVWFEGGHGGSQRNEHLETMFAFAQRAVKER